MKRQKCCFIIIAIFLILVNASAQDKYRAVHWDIGMVYQVVW